MVIEIFGHELILRQTQSDPLVRILPIVSALAPLIFQLLRPSETVAEETLNDLGEKTIKWQRGVDTDVAILEEAVEVLQERCKKLEELLASSPPHTAEADPVYKAAETAL